MTLERLAVKRLLMMTLVYVALLALTGELRWPSAAVVLFAGAWTAQLVAELWKARRIPTP